MAAPPLWSRNQTWQTGFTAETSLTSTTISTSRNSIARFDSQTGAEQPRRRATIEEPQLRKMKHLQIDFSTAEG
jgi:hypothetical protein